MVSPSSVLHGFLSRCRRRLLGKEILAGAAAIGSTLLGILGLTVLIYLAKGSLGAFRAWLLLLLLAGFAFAAFLYLLGPWLRWRRNAGLAREVERRLLDDRLELVSAVQLEQLLPQLQETPTVSPALVEAHIERVGGLVGKLDPRKLLAPRWWLLPFGVFFSLLVGVALLLAVVPESFGAALSSLVFPPPAPAGQVGAQGPSWLGDIRLAYRYPAYTGRADRVLEGTDGAIQALPGTEVSITSKADREIRKAKVTQAEGSLPFTVRNGREVSGQLVVMKAGSYRFEMEGQDGEVWDGDRPHPIHLESDRVPEVVLTKPESDLVVREKDALEVRFNASDDYGITEVRLVYRVSNRAEGEQRRPLRQPPDRTRRLSRETFRWDLAQLRLAPGEQVQFYLEAVDNDTVLGPKLGRSATQSLKVFSAEEHHRGLTERAQGAWEKLLARLADALDQEPLVRTGTVEDLAAHRQAYRETEELLDEIRRLEHDLSLDRLAWAPLRAALGNVRRGMANLQSELKWLLDAAGGETEKPSLADLGQLGQHRTRRIDQLERDVLYLEDLLDLERLEDLDRMARELTAARERLSQLMEQYRRAPSDEARKQIEAEIARLKQQVAQLLARQSEVLKGVRDEYFNPEALQKLMAERDLVGALDQIQKMLMEGQFDKAMAELDRLQNQLKQLQDAIDLSRSNFGLGKYAELAQAVARIQGQLNQIAETQRRLMDRTGRLRQQAIERLKKLWGAKLKAQLAVFRERLKNVVARLQAVPQDLADHFTSQDRADALDQAKSLDKLLEAGDVAGSLEAAAKLVSAADRLAENLQSMARFEGRFDPDRRQRLDRAHRDSAEAYREADSIRRDLEKLLPAPEQLLQKKERGEIERLAREQAGLKSQLRQMKNEMQQLNQKAPLFGKDLLGGTERGEQAMGQASSELGRQDPRAAYPHQQSALSELERLREAIQKGCKSGRCPMPMPMGGVSGSGADFGGPGGEMSREKVEIPGPEDFRPQEAFRKDLLDGMKDPVPEVFRPQVREYYEELVK